MEYLKEDLKHYPCVCDDEVNEFYKDSCEKTETIETPEVNDDSISVPTMDVQA